MPENDLGNRPLWNHVDIIEADVGDGIIRFRCKYCTHEYRGSYNRVQAHLLNISKKGIRSCPNMTNSTIQQLHIEVAAAEEN